MRRVERATGSLLLLAAVASAAYVFMSSSPGRPAEVAMNAPVNGVVPEVVVAYFYGGIRCDTCEKLESYAREAVRADFGPELASGRIAWRTFDMERPQNEVWTERFGLYTKSVVLVALENGEPVRWENLSSIWDLVHDRDAYQRYIRESLRAFLEAPGHGE